MGTDGEGSEMGKNTSGWPGKGGAGVPPIWERERALLFQLDEMFFRRFRMPCERGERACVCGLERRPKQKGEMAMDGRMDEVIDGSSSLPSSLQDQDPLHPRRPTETDLIPSLMTSNPDSLLFKSSP